MDTEARIEAAKARLEANRAVLVRAREAGPTCDRCAYFVPRKTGLPPGRIDIGGPYCGHPAYSDHQFKPATGLVVQEVGVPTDQARAPEGLCGPEAVLYEPNLFSSEGLAEMAGKATKGAILFFAVAGVLAVGDFVVRLLPSLF